MDFYQLTNPATKLSNEWQALDCMMSKKLLTTIALLINNMSITLKILVRWYWKQIVKQYLEMIWEKRCFEVRNILQFSCFNIRYINLTSKCLKMLSLIEQQLSLLLLQRNTNASGFLSLYCNCFCLHNHSRYFYIKRVWFKKFLNFTYFIAPLHRNRSQNKVYEST